MMGRSGHIRRRVFLTTVDGSAKDTIANSHECFFSVADAVACGDVRHFNQLYRLRVALRSCKIQAHAGYCYADVAVLDDLPPLRACTRISRRHATADSWLKCRKQHIEICNRIQQPRRAAVSAIKTEGRLTRRSLVSIIDPLLYASRRRRC